MITQEQNEKDRATLEKVTQRYSEAKQFWIQKNRSRFDQYYKNFRDYGEDRLNDLKKIRGESWMSNLFVPLTSSHIRSILPRITDSSPQIIVYGRTADDHARAEKIQALMEYIWEKSKADREMGPFVLQAMIYGTSWGKAMWSVKHRAKSKKTLIDSEEDPEIDDSTKYYDDPDFETIDVYDLFPDPHACNLEQARYFCQRYIMTKEQIVKTWSNLKNLDKIKPGGDTEDLKSVRDEVSMFKFSSKRGDNKEKSVEDLFKGNSKEAFSSVSAKPSSSSLYEVVEYWEDDQLAIVVNGVLVRDGENPLPTKKPPYVKIVYDELPFEMYGVGIAEEVEQIQYAINSIRNQRIDAATLNIHKMFIVNPTALISDSDMVIRPMGHIRTQDMDAIRALEFGDIKQSAYAEDDILMETAKFATGIDDYTRGVGGQASTTATAVAAQKESTAGRAQNFIKIVEGDGISEILRMWMEYAKEFYPLKTVRRIVEPDGEFLVDSMEGEEGAFDILDVPVRVEKNGGVEYPLITSDDIGGYYDFKIGTNTTVAGTQDLKLKKLLELLDRAVAGGIDPTTGQPILNLRKIWEEVIPNFGMLPANILAQESDQQSGQAQQQGIDLSRFSGDNISQQLLAQSGQDISQIAAPDGIAAPGPLPESGSELGNAFQQ